jgi:hypothetical protein
MRNTGITIILFLSTIIIAIVALVACSPTSDSSSSSSTPSSSLTGTWERSCYSANYDEEYNWLNDPVRLYGKQEVVITSETITSTTTGFTDSNCTIEVGTVIVTSKYLIGDGVEVYPVKEAEAFDLAKVSATKAGLYQMNVSITPKTVDAVNYLSGQSYPILDPLDACSYEDWTLNKETTITGCHSFEPYNASNYHNTVDQKAFAVFQVSGNQLLFEVRNDAYPTYFGLNSFTKR